MAWCKRDVSDFFRVKFLFLQKVPEFLHVLFNLVEKHSPECIFFGLNCSCSALLLQYFVFVFLRNKVQTSHKKYREMFYYLIEKHMQKFRHF